MKLDSRVQHLLVFLTHPHVKAWNFDNRLEQIIKNKLPNVEISVVHHSKQFLDKLPQSDAVIVWYFKKDWYDLADELCLISTPAAGQDWIEPPPKNSKFAKNNNFQVWHGGFHGPLIAESVLGAIFFFLKAFSLSIQMQSRKKWARIKISDQIRSLLGERVTIYGFGKIGQAIGKALKPFGCKITGVKRKPIDAPDFFDKDDDLILSGNLQDTLEKTEHLIFCLPGGDDTNEIFTRDDFSKLSNRTFLYNIGRGNVYSEEDLKWAIETNHLAGAYLDVFNEEPLSPDSPLWQNEKILIQPHLSAASPCYLEQFLNEWIARFKNESL